MAGLRSAALAFLLATAAVAAASPPNVGAAADPSHGSPLGSRAASGVRVTMPPAGLSIEYPILAQDMGSGPCPPPALVAELLRLGSPPLRIGGDSQDLTAPAGALSGSPESWRAGTLYQLPAGFWSRLHCLLAASHDPLTVGINAETGSLSWAQQIAAGARQAATGALVFSIGNEPDLYALPDYASLGNRAIDVPAAVHLYLQLAELLRPALAATPLEGPELARPGAWRAWLPLVLARLGVSVLGVHDYPLSGCLTPRAVTLHGLLSPSVSRAPSRLRWVVADAAAAGIPAVISEANSASCGGKAGVSDTPASRVWAIRFVISALLTGFREVRFHVSGGAYDPFVVRGAAVVERPLAGAIAAINRWLPIGSALRSQTTRSGLLETVISGSTQARLILDNETRRARRAVLPGALPTTVQLLSASRYGVATVVVQPRHGRLALALPAQSVAVLP